MIPPTAPPKRYANVELIDPQLGTRLDATAPLQPLQKIRLQIDIGALSPESHVINPTIFPDKLLPRDIYLDVMVSSTDFTLTGNNTDENGQIAHGRFFLPGDGAPAIACDKTTFLNFELTAPTNTGTAHCRIGYYYRNILVQSQKLTATVGLGDGPRITTDFTITRDLTGLEQLPTRPRVSMLTNANGADVHQVVIRSVDSNSENPKAQTFTVKETTLGETLRALRATLSERSPATKERSRADLEQDLRLLAPHGWSLYTQLPGQRPYLFADLKKSPEKFVVQVLRPTTSDFVVPWGLIYEIPLLSDRPTTCPLISQWNGHDPLVADGQRTCPHGPHLQDVLCPFGFWGFRYSIEQLASSDSPVLEIRAGANCEMVMAQTQAGVDLKALAGHIDALSAILQHWLPTAKPNEGKDKTTVRDILGRDLPLVYFYCHGERLNIADPNIWLSVGKRETLTTEDFIGWLVAWQTQNKVVWDKVRPLIFINACHSVAILPTTLISYVDAFIGSARAAGVIGAETKIQQTLAAKFAERFFDLLLTGAKTVDSALRTIRLEHLSQGNLLGLLYTPYCWADLRILRP